MLCNKSKSYINIDYINPDYINLLKMIALISSILIILYVNVFMVGGDREVILLGNKIYCQYFVMVS